MPEPVVGMILAAGYGTRLEPLTKLRPKAIMEVAASPIIYHQIKSMEKAGIKNIYINTHYLSDKLIDKVNLLDVKSKIHWSLEQDILGTAGGIKKILNQYCVDADEMLIMHGDMICDVDLSSLLGLNNFALLLGAHKRQLEGYPGGLSIDNDGLIVELGRFYRSKCTAVASGFFTGLHVLSREALSLLSQSSYSCLVSELYPEWLKLGYKLKAQLNEEMAYEDLGNIERLFDANMAICSSTSSYQWVNYSNNYQLTTNAHIIEPVIIANSAIVEDGAQVGPMAVIGENVLISSKAQVRNSVIMSETTIEKDENLDCVIALEGARILVKDYKGEK